MVLKGWGGAKDRGTAAVAALAVAVLAYLAASPELFNDGDTSWHLAVGKLILATHGVPTSDPFSYTFAGRPWTAHEWLSEAIMGAAFNAGSWSALAILFGAAVAVLLLIIGLEARRWLPPARALILLLFVVVGLTPFMLARPHVLAWAILAGWTLILLRARERDGAPPYSAALLMLVWANMHGSFVFGLMIAGLFGLEDLVAAEERKAVLLRWGGFGLACLVAAVATPHGIEGLLFPLKLSAMKTLPLISEWRATVPAEEKAFLLLLLGTIVVLLYRGVRVPPLRLLLLAALMFLAFEHVRHQAVLVIVGALLLIEPLGRSFDEAPEHRPLPRALALMLLAGLLVIAAIRIAVPMERPDSTSNPVTALRHVAAGLRAKPVYNSYGFGGPLILDGIRPYIDGRADMYGDAWLFQNQRIVDGDMQAFDQAVRRWGIAWTILDPAEGLAKRLDRAPGWRRLYADRWAVIHVRSGT